MSRAERRRRTSVIVARRNRQIYSLIYGWGEVDSRIIGRCKSLSPFDCGRPRCNACSGYKRYNAGKTRAEKIFDLNYVEQLEGLSQGIV